jgi:hypothetical protein
MIFRHTTRIAGALALALATHASGAVVAAPGYLVRTIPLPGIAVGGVVRHGSTLWVGQGTFGAGTESVIRLDGPQATTIATGFNSLGGFDTDGATLYVVDNCFECTGATTGDSLYAIPDARARMTAVTADASAVLPAGTIPAAQDVLVVPGAILVSDAVGPGASRIVRVVGTMTTDLVTGLDYLGGLATDGSTLFVDNVDGTTFIGSVLKYSLAGVSQGTLVTGLSGAYGIARDEAGNMLVSGGSTSDFSSSTLEAVGSGGTVTERAHGFEFSGDVFFDADRQTALVLDFGADVVTAICRDADADGVCDGDCAGPASITAAQLTLDNQETPAGDDKLTLKGEMTIADPYDPVTTGAHVLVEDAMGEAVVAVAVPPGAYDPATKVGWKANGSATAWTYKNPLGVDGITSIVLKKKKQPGTVKFVVKGKQGRYPVTGATLPLRVVFAVDPAGKCGLATLTGADCRFKKSGKTFVCE